MCPDIDWKINDESGEHAIVKTTSTSHSRRRRIVLGIVILLGVSLGVIYSSIAEPTVKPTLTNAPTLRSTFSGRPTLEPTASSRPTHLQPPALSPTIIPISSSLSCRPTAGSVWYSWLANQSPAAVHTLLTDHGTVWAGTSLGVRRINPQTDADVAYEELGDTDMLLPVEDGRMWAVSKRGLFYFDGNHWIKPEMDTTDKYFYQLGIDQAGDLRALSSAGRYPESYHYSGHTPPLISIKGPANASVDSNPTVCTQWQTITTGSYIHRSPAECDALNQARWKIYRELTQDYPVMAIAADQSVWWAARNTLGHLSDTQSSSYALPVGQIYALASDPERGVWIGTDRGLAYFDDSTLRWVSLGLEQCALQGVPKDIVVDAHGVAWLLTTNGEVLRFAPGDRNWTAVTEFRTTAQGRPVQALVAAPTGGIWISHGYDLQYFDGNTLIQSTTVPIYTYGVHNLFVDPAGIVWNLGECERYQFNPNTDQWSGYDLCNLHKSSDLTAPVMVRDGSFYSLDSDGLIAYPPFANTATASQKHLVASIPDLEDLSFLAADRQDGVWIASCRQHALWHYQNGKLTVESQGTEWQSLGDTNAFCPRQLYVDDQNRLWISLYRRLIMIDHQMFQDIPVSVGMISKLTSGPDGRIWIVGEQGVGIYDPAADRQP